MAFRKEDRVRETSTTTGTGAFALAGAVDDYQAFGDVCSVSDTLPYGAYNSGAPSEWETGFGTYSDTNELTRTEILASSNGGAAVDFSAGEKIISLTPNSKMFGWQQIGATQTPSGVASSSITSIPQYYDDLLIEILGLSHDLGSSQRIQIEFSPDGATWTSPIVIGPNSSASATLYGQYLLPNYRGVAGSMIGLIADLSTDNSSTTPLGSAVHSWRIASGINALRLSVGSGDFDAGSWKLWGR